MKLRSTLLASGSLLLLIGTAAAQMNRPPAAAAPARNLVLNPEFEKAGSARDTPEGYELSGRAQWNYTGYQDEVNTLGIALESYSADGNAAGSVSQLVRNLDPKYGKWLRFSFRGLPEDGFKVRGDQLFMKLDFLSKGGTNYLDSAERLIYREVEQDRKVLTVNGNYGRGGAAVWRSYAFEELLPFPEVDAVQVTVGFKNGSAAEAKHSAFFVDDFSLTQNAASFRGQQDPAEISRPTPPPPAASPEGMVALGGRWYYRPAPGERVETASGKLSGSLKVTEANADRLFYRDHLLVNPFAGNMTAWLRKGHLDREGRIVSQDRFVPDNVTLGFTAGSEVMVVHARNIPNHATARFPDRYGTQGYNPSYIQEHDYTYYLPLVPKPNPQAAAMTPNNSNRALPMGSVGFAVNGVVFYNPFDAGMQDASSIMDRCCGHPSPDNRYHYHKYPICVNTPFLDKGEGHSPVIGFAFDGIPVYGPYESRGLMAKDDPAHPLNAFNLHEDAVRGLHYHVTPGKFPYIIGGYFGQVDSHNFDRRGPRRFALPAG